MDGDWDSWSVLTGPGGGPWCVGRRRKGVTPLGLRPRGLVQRCFQEGVRASYQARTLSLFFRWVCFSSTKMVAALWVASLGKEEGSGGGERCEGTDPG